MKHTVHNIIILFKTYPFYNYVTFATYQIEPNGKYHSVLLIERSKEFLFCTSLAFGPKMKNLISFIQIQS